MYFNWIIKLNGRVVMVGSAFCPVESLSLALSWVRTYSKISTDDYSKLVVEVVKLEG